MWEICILLDNKNKPRNGLPYSFHVLNFIHKALGQLEVIENYICSWFHTVELNLESHSGKTKFIDHLGLMLLLNISELVNISLFQVIRQYILL